MPRFHYQAKQSPTQTVQGTVHAENKKSAIEEISRQGLQVLSVSEEGSLAAPVPASAPSASFFFGRVGIKETTHFSRQLADLLESGLPMIRALDLLQNQTRNKKFKASIDQVKERCAAGTSLSQAMAEQPDVFPHLFSVLCRAGETGGSLDRALRRLSEFNEKQIEIRARLSAALAYPMLMVGVGILTILVLLLFVIPRMAGIFEDMGRSLPMATQVLLFLSHAATQHFGVLAVGSIVLFWALGNYYRTSAGKKTFDQFVLNIPVLGELLKKIEMARFSQTLSTLLENGVPILEALRLSSDAVGNAVLRAELEAGHSAVKGGARLSQAFSQSRTMLPAVIQMIGVGEESGRLEKTLQKIADNYDRETDQSIKVALALLEPGLILVLGLVVGFMVIAILLPIFEMSLSVR